MAGLCLWTPRSRFNSNRPTIMKIYSGLLKNLSRCCHSECSWACGPPKGMKVAVILSEAKDVQFRTEAN